MMSNDLFVRLALYAPREGQTFIENFFTELVGYLLKREPAACRDFLEVVFGSQAEDFRVQEVAIQGSIRK